MAQLKKDDIVLSFDNTSGRMIVLSTDGVSEWTHEPSALCRCLEAHPHGYEIGYEGWWRYEDLTKILSVGELICRFDDAIELLIKAHKEIKDISDAMNVGNSELIKEIELFTSNR